jgi:hypothetical protein
VRPRIDLFLLRDGLADCAETTYFSARLHEFTSRLIAAIDHVLKYEATYGADTVRLFAAHVRSVHRYLSGSTTKEALYEIEHCLKAALRVWTKREYLITTALTAEQDFHLRPADPWVFIKTTISDFDTAGFDALLVQLGVPRIYSHKPIYCIPLYHELGHFVDVTLGITRLSLLLLPPTGKPTIELSHRMEHFADLFAACYAGKSSILTLETIAPGESASTTHPATADRIAVVENFLNSRPAPVTDLFGRCLSMLSAPALKPMFRTPDIRNEYDDIRPYQIKSEEELHGLFDAAWTYLGEVLDEKRSPKWAKPNLTDADIERVINDLTEKSIRNHSVLERWAIGASP